MILLGNNQRYSLYFGTVKFCVFGYLCRFKGKVSEEISKWEILSVDKWRGINSESFPSVGWTSKVNV